MKIAIICKYPFPEGLAATNRIIAYSKGIIKAGGTVDLFLLIPMDQKNSIKYSYKGSFDGINYYYTAGIRKYKNRFLHGLQIIYGIIIGGFVLIKRCKKANYNSLIISSDSNCILFYYGRLGKFQGIKTIFIFDEYPTPIREKLKDKVPKLKIQAYKMSLKSIDGYISISKKLIDFYNGIRPKPALLMSIVMDFERFENVLIKEKRANKQICYVGNMQLSKDNIDNIIKAFAQISNIYSDLELCLYGLPSNEDRKIIESLIQELNIAEKVFIKVASYDEVPYILCNADILVSSQPNTKRASGGFPTKLGEYLASGVPTVMVDVGEISTYVNHMKHLFLVKAEDPTEFALMLDFVIKNYDLAKEIAYEGKKIIQTLGSNSLAGKRIINFIEKLE